MRELFQEGGDRSRGAADGHRHDRPRQRGPRPHYTSVAVIGHWQSGEGTPGDDADGVAWLTRAEIVEQNLPTAPALLLLIDLALRKS